MIDSFQTSCLVRPLADVAQRLDPCLLVVDRRCASATRAAHRLCLSGRRSGAARRLRCSWAASLSTGLSVRYPGGIQTKILEHIKPLSAQLASRHSETSCAKQVQMRELRKGGKLLPAEILPTIRRLIREAGLTEGIAAAR